MKLTTKLLLAFSTTIVLIMFISYLSWSTASKFDRQKNVLAYGDNIVAAILSADKSALAAVSGNQPELFKEVKKYLQDIYNNCDNLLEIAHQQKTRDHLINIKNTTDKYIPVIDQILKLYTQFHDTQAALMKAGYAIRDSLAAVEKNTEQTYNQTGNAEPLLTTKAIGESFTNTRLAVSNFLIAYSEENLAVVNQRIQELKDKAATHKNEPLFAPIFKDIEAYLEAATPVFTINKDLHAVIQQGMEYSAYNLEEGAAITDIAHKAFARVEGEVRRSTLYAVGFSVLLGIALAILLSRNVMRQLGADPSDLSVLAERVTNGDYDINDGKPHIGVYSNIINMVEKLKETLQFSQNVLSSMPIPVAVFGSNNKLKYA
ncbi:MAG: hypothetical protein K2I05_04755, partial [Mailhella sp.]|nr:hypothetical protein [Mailhella sp.]